MAKNLGTDVSHTFENDGYGFDSVVFQNGKPIMDAELNFAQQVQQDMLRKISSSNGSGWVSFRAALAEAGVPNAFFTQDPQGAIPEVAMVNGWPVTVANTNITDSCANKVDMSEFPLISGYRADGVFLEVWRGLIDDQTSGVTTPTDYTQFGVLRSVCAISDNIAWAVGDNGLLLKTDNGGGNWLVQKSPTGDTLYSVKFIDTQRGFIAGVRGSLYKTENGGSSWAKIALPITDDIFAMETVGASLMVLGGANGTLLRSVDMFNFELITNMVQATEDILSVHFYDSAVGWACGKNGQYLKTLDGGITWKLYTIKVSDSSNTLQEKKVTEQLNAIRFLNLNDGWVVGNNGLILRTTDGGLRWSDTSISIYDADTNSYSKTLENLNSFEVISVSPMTMKLSIANHTRIASISYVLGTTTLELSYVPNGSNVSTKKILVLADYPDSASLESALLEIQDVGGFRVLSVTREYTSTVYGAHDNSAVVTGTNVASLRFSMNTEAWITGDNGTVLYTSNGGARWTKKDAKVSFNVYAASFRSEQLGWVVGDQGEISKFTSDAQTKQHVWADQDTDLVKQLQRKVYREGNVLSPTSLNLANNLVHPSVKVETTARTQVQYRIRVVEGVDIRNFREAGLGSAYVYSRGPNSTVVSAGSYSYENMGLVTGDYGLWRARCRNTVDGYSYAIPMFLVTLRNRQPYSATANVNGTSVDSVGSIRPDGLTYEDITHTDILDLRRKISSVQVSHILEKAFDDLLAGNLETSMVSSSLRGGQVGVYHTMVDDLTEENVTSLFKGNYNSEAVANIEKTVTSIVDGGKQGVTGVSPEFATFESLKDGIYHHSLDYYSATYKSTTDATTGLDGVNIPGYFTGTGTPQAMFVFGSANVQQAGVSYEVKGAYIDYSHTGLTATPAKPLQVKDYIAGDQTSTRSYQGVLAGVTAQKARVLSTGISGFADYAEISANGFGDTATCASMVRLHIHQQVNENTKQLKVLKNIEGYFVFAVRDIRNLTDGGYYRVSSLENTYAEDANYLTINLASTFTVVSGECIEIIAEAISVEGLEGNGLVTGLTTEDLGDSIDATRSPFVAVFDSTTRGVTSLYKGVLRAITKNGSVYPVSNLNIEGIATMSMLEADRVPYAWTAAGKTVPLSWYYSQDTTGAMKKDGFVVKAGVNEDDYDDVGTLYFPILEKMTQADGQSISASYKKHAPQTLQPLPETIQIQIVECARDLSVISLGNGGGLRSDHYLYPLEQVPQYDSLSNQSFFFNVLGMELASFYEAGGHVYLPMRVRRQPGQTITLGTPSQDSMGRTFYRTTSEKLQFTAESMSLGNPRKLVVPMLVKVVSSIVSPALRGELLLAVVTSYENTKLENKVLIGPESGEAVISLYKVPGMPILK